MGQSLEREFRDKEHLRYRRINPLEDLHSKGFLKSGLTSGSSSELPMFLEGLVNKEFEYFGNQPLFNFLRDLKKGDGVLDVDVFVKYKQGESGIKGVHLVFPQEDLSKYQTRYSGLFHN